MPSIPYDFRHSLEFRKITLFLGRKEPESLEERNYVLQHGIDIIDFIIPNTVFSLAHCSALKMLFEEDKYYGVFLRYVETQGYLPWKQVIASRAEGYVETSLAVRKSRKIISHIRRYPFAVQLHFSSAEKHESFLLIVRT